MDLEGTDGRERGEVIDSILDVSSHPVTNIALCMVIKQDSNSESEDLLSES
jgi:hypothetical protein